MATATFTPTTNPMIIPASALVVTTSAILSRPIFAKRIEWFQPLTTLDTIKLVDINGNILVEGACEVASQSQILWAGPQKLTLPGKAAATSSWSVINNYATGSSATLIIWF